jgi:RNA polymerase sigma-70 factor (ECF subfamily)
MAKEIARPVDLPLVGSDPGASVEAIELIYQQRFHRFVRVAQAITRSREMAVDAVQEAFATVLRNRRGYRGTGTVEAWVWSSVVNAARQAVRERAGIPIDSLELFAPATAGDEVGMRSVIAVLPERQRLVLFLRYYADLDYRAIADALDLELGTVGATLNQAHRNLRRLLAEVSAG